MRIKCPDCNGTGTEQCEVHGTHKCERCNGRGCIEKRSIFDGVAIGVSPPWKPWTPSPYHYCPTSKKNCCQGFDKEVIF